MKKISAVLTAVIICLFVTACGGKDIQPIDMSQFTQMPQYTFQDLRTWGQGEVTMPDIPTDQDGFVAYHYKLKQNVLEEYIAMMEQNGYALVGKYSRGSMLGSFKSYGLICNEASDIETISQMYSKDKCHVSIWQDGSEWRVDVADGIDIFDIGLRRDGSIGNTMPKGESVAVGLKQKSGDKYITSDKRFTVKTGESDVLVDGKSYKAETSWKGITKIKVNVEISDDLTAQIEYEKDKIAQGDIYQLCSTENYPLTFKLISGDEDIGISQKGAAHYNNVTVRVMALNDDNDTVIYIYAEPMDTENYPQTIEMLCAINTTPPKSDNSGGGSSAESNRNPFQPDHSKLDCLTCNGTGDCKECGGALYVYYGGNRAKCGTCKGSGDCRTCGGSGKR